MRGTMMGLFRATLCGVVILSMGCEDPKKKIAQLEEEKAALGDQLVAASEARDTAEADAAEAKQRNAALQSALNEAKQAPAAAPAPPALFKFVGALSTTDLGRVNKPELSAKAKAQLDGIVSAIRSEHADSHVYVIGHTDNDPIRRTKWKDNLELSSQRAMAVVRYLAGKGISQTHLLAAGSGEYSPLAPNTSSANKAKNRRVEIYAGPAPSR